MYAIYPRAIVSSDIADACSNQDSLIKTDWDCPFIDYLQMSIEEGFVTDELNVYRQSLITHIVKNNNMNGCRVDHWDRIRSKDVWALSYYNDFCSTHGCDDLIIDFEECYVPLRKRIEICIDNAEGGYLNG